MATLSHTDWNVGSHISFEGCLEKTIYKAINYGMYSCQFFLGNPKSFTRKRVTTEDIEAGFKLTTEFPLNVFSHAPYLYNLNGSKSCLAWEGNEQDKKTEFILKELEYELGVISKLTTKTNGVVVHPGNYPDRTKGLLTIAKSIDKINFPENSKLLIENSAGQGTSLGTTIEELATIYNNTVNKKNVGVCIDTCHLFAYGEYDIRSCYEIDRFFSEFDKQIGIDNLKLIHLNDSMTPLGSRKDRHALLKTGYIWKESDISLVYLLNKCWSYDIPLVLETHPSDMATINTLN